MEDQLIDKWGEWIDVNGLTAGDSDVYYTFSGKIASSLKSGKNNPLYGKRVNLNEMYNRMMDDIVRYVQSDEFLSYCGGHAIKDIRRYTSEKHGVTIDWIYNKLNKGRDNDDRMSTDDLYRLMIDHVGGMDRIDWVGLYNRISIHTNNTDIIEYIANGILKGNIYKYFVDRYNLRVDGIKFGPNRGKVANSYYVVLKWGDKMEKPIILSEIIYDKRDWWKNNTHGKVKRVDIKDYDLFLSGRSEDVILPDRCPVDNNIVMNYTGIDFTNKDKNINECKNHDGIEDVWSFASIDRIDSNKPYTYDNVQIISHYYNSQVKNCASNEQIVKLYNYQTKIKSELYPIEYMI